MQIHFLVSLAMMLLIVFPTPCTTTMASVTTHLMMMMIDIHIEKQEDNNLMMLLLIQQITNVVDGRFEKLMKATYCILQVLLESKNLVELVVCTTLSSSPLF